MTWLVVVFYVAVSLSDLRVPGVLQRFAATYMVVALTEAFSSRLYNWKSVSMMILYQSMFMSVCNPN